MPSNCHSSKRPPRKLNEAVTPRLPASSNRTRSELLLLENVLQRELNDSGRTGTSDATERPGAEVGVRVTEVRSVDEVEELRAELQRLPLDRRLGVSKTAIAKIMDVSRTTS